MENFKEFQFGRTVILILIPAQIALCTTYLLKLGTTPTSLMSVILLNAVFASVYLLFYGMKTTIDGENIFIRYGIGLIRKTIKLAEVNSATVVSTPWYYGWGIRFLPNGMLYNISGREGVELTFKTRSRIIRIGSAHAGLLQKAISARIQAQRAPLS